MKKYTTIVVMAFMILSLAACNDDGKKPPGSSSSPNLPNGGVFICINGDRIVTFYEDKVVDSTRPTDHDVVGQIFLTARTRETTSGGSKSGQGLFKQTFGIFDPDEKKPALFYEIKSMQLGGAGGFTHYSIHSPRHQFVMYCDQSKYSEKMSELSNFKWAVMFDEDFQRNIKIQKEQAEAKRAAKDAEAKLEAEKRAAETKAKQEVRSAQAKQESEKRMAEAKVHQAKRGAEIKKQQEREAKKKREAKVRSLF